ncbi:uncharacterized protein LOC128878037 [Hylaeus volcanicus]|uniref:uncharacterized protein LOC128878037 n=1 Tax=Hylaeus volcanicus TaxID=313075 RepID=UPI0023B7E08B|nr:uncharacterized protein LOC128878037 [Hylaeus volcanicus]XP_053981803.1 uncharacterized protein LOC128878037 [Hylaeus volcanicus]XP_053981804.1 uncharacterized protein LOC128878037 [Hylaeus volcanicus]XP_053981806.1 uncharacterized protein LOC128878037 [Hylaeus volcanicus]
MTFKNLMNLGNLAKDSYRPPIDRYHSGPSGYHHSGSGGYHHSGSGGYHHGSRGSYKGKGGSGAALSALTLLAFLFLINVMQQSLQDNNSTTSTMAPTVILRDGDHPVALDAKEEDDKKGDVAKRDGSYRTPAKSKIERLNNQYIK